MQIIQIVHAARVLLNDWPALLKSKDLSFISKKRRLLYSSTNKLARTLYEDFRLLPISAEGSEDNITEF